MQNVVLLFALSFLGMQEDPLTEDIHARVAQLSSDSIQERDDGLRALIRMGPPALPLLQKKSGESDDLEVQSRLQEAIKRIQLNEKLAASFGPPSRVTIEAEDTPLSEIVRKINEATTSENVALDESIARLRLTLHAKDVPVYEALRLIGKATEGAFPHYGRELGIRAGRFAPDSVIVEGPIAIEAREVRLTRSVNGDSRRELEVTLGIRHEKGVKPLGVVARVNGYEPKRVYSMVGVVMPSVLTRTFTREGDLGPDVRQLDLSGSVTYHFALENKWLELAIPASKDQTTELKLENGRLTLSISLESDNEFEVSLDYEYQDGESGRDYFDLYRRFFSRESIKIYDASNKTMELVTSGSGSRSSSGGAMRGIGRSFDWKWDDDRPAKIRIILPSKIHPHRIPFSFKGVPLE